MPSFDGGQYPVNRIIEFIADNSKEVPAINFYLECLIELKQFDEVEIFINSLEKEVKDQKEIKQLIKKLEIIKNNLVGPDINELIKKLEKKPNDINLIIDIAGKHFSNQDYENCMEVLLNN